MEFALPTEYTCTRVHVCAPYMVFWIILETASALPSTALTTCNMFLTFTTPEFCVYSAFLYFLQFLGKSSYSFLIRITPSNWPLNQLIFTFLKPTGYVMHQHFDIQQLYALPTLYLCVLYLSENKQRLVPLTA